MMTENIYIDNSSSVFKCKVYGYEA